MIRKSLLFACLLALGACASNPAAPCCESNDAAACEECASDSTASCCEESSEISAAQLPAELQIRNFKVISQRVSGGGTPSNALVAAMPSLGYSTIINMKTVGESGNDAEAAAAAAAGLHYVHIPVSGATASLTNSADLLRALESAPDGKILVHCRSGNRVGCIWGMATAINEGLTIEKAIVVARRAGMRSDALATRIASELGK